VDKLTPYLGEVSTEWEKQKEIALRTAQETALREKPRSLDAATQGEAPPEVLFPSVPEDPSSSTELVFQQAEEDSRQIQEESTGVDQSSPEVVYSCDDAETRQSSLTTVYFDDLSAANDSAQDEENPAESDISSLFQQPASAAASEEVNRPETGDEPDSLSRRQPARQKQKPIRFRQIQAANHSEDCVLLNNSVSKFQRVSDVTTEVLSNGHSYQTYIVYPQPGTAETVSSTFDAVANDTTTAPDRRIVFNIFDDSATADLASEHFPILRNDIDLNSFWQFATCSGCFWSDAADIDRSTADRSFLCAAVLRERYEHVQSHMYSYANADYCFCSKMENNNDSSDEDSKREDGHRSKRSRQSFTPPENRTFQCDQCASTFTQFCGADRHMVVTHGRYFVKDQPSELIPPELLERERNVIRCSRKTRAAKDAFWAKEVAAGRPGPPPPRRASVTSSTAALTSTSPPIANSAATGDTGPTLAPAVAGPSGRRAHSPRVFCDADLDSNDDELEALAMGVVCGFDRDEDPVEDFLEDMDNGSRQDLWFDLVSPPPVVRPEIGVQVGGGGGVDVSTAADLRPTVVDAGAQTVPRSTRTLGTQQDLLVDPPPIRYDAENQTAAPPTCDVKTQVCFKPRQRNMTTQAGGGCTTFVDSTDQTDNLTPMPEGLEVRHVIDAVRSQPTVTAEQILMQFAENGVQFNALQAVVVQSIAASAMATIIALGEDIRAILATSDHTDLERMCAAFQPTAQRVSAEADLGEEQRRWAGFTGPIFAAMTPAQQAAYTNWCTVKFATLRDQQAEAAAKQVQRARLWEERFLNEYNAAQAAAAQREIERAAALANIDARRRRAEELDRQREESEIARAREQAARDVTVTMTERLRAGTVGRDATPSTSAAANLANDTPPPLFEVISDSDSE
jgi:hypothetical protein